MREAGERLLAGYPGFISMNGTAEATTLPAASVDFVTAGQAFHWFDQAKARSEFARVLNPGGWVVLVWNERQVGTTPFLEDYEDLLMRWGTDYGTVRSRCARSDVAALAQFFGAEGYRLESFPNRQDFDLDGLIGRVKSSSYTPEPGHPSYDPMMAALEELFMRHRTNGTVAFEYDTNITFGRLAPGG
jgi:SAM-dependent methyltransferase